MFWDKSIFAINRIPPAKKRIRRFKKEEPFLCPACKKVWQPHVSCVTRKPEKAIPEYLVGFPKIECNKLKCRKCTNEK